MHAGLLPEEARRELASVIANRARAGAPVSFARLLLKGGLGAEDLERLLARGASLHAVCCDGCGAERSQRGLTVRREFPCPRCGALMLGFAAFAQTGSGRLALPAGVGKTAAFPKVLPLPSGQTPLISLAQPVPVNVAERTLAFGQVLEVPLSKQVTSDCVYVLPGAEARSEEESFVVLSALSGEGESPFGEAGEGKRGFPRESIAGFRLLDAIGEGGMGQVFLAEKDGERVALKLMLPGHASDKVALKRFKQEGEALSRVQHPNIVRVVASGFDDAAEIHYLALEYMGAGSLTDLLDRTPQLGERRALEITRDVAQALQAAADERIVHRDVKPGNILLGDRGQAKLADLGLIKDVDSGVQITATGLVMGTPAFMSPEQALGDKELDTRTDLYALGCVLYQMLTGRVPFVEPGLNVIDIVRRRLKEDLPDPRVITPQVSGAAAELVSCMTRRDREERYPSPHLVIRDIERLLAGGDVLGPDDYRIDDAPPLDTGRSYAPPPEGSQSATETTALPALGGGNDRLLLMFGAVTFALAVVIFLIVALRS